MTTAGKPIQCRAAVAWEVDKPFSLETVEVAVPKKGEVRVKMASTGVCHSDLHNLEGIDKSYPFPGVFGHEGAGVIESVGEGVTSVKPGDKVVLVFESHCGDCANCKSTKTHLCRKTPRNQLQMDGTSRITCKGQALSQMNSISTFSEYTVTSEFNVAKVNPAANPNILCLAGCCIPTGYGAVMNAGQVTPGSSCAIWGLGGVGMCVVMGCRDSGAAKIIGLDVNSSKFQLAKEFGCTDVLNPKEVNVPEKLAEMTGGGPDFCFVSVGLIPVMLGDEKPSHLLRKMKELSNGQLQDDFLQSLWLQRMPPHIQTVLSASSEPLDKLAIIADKVSEVVGASSTICAATTVPPPSQSSSCSAQPTMDSLARQIQELSLQVAELTRERNSSRHQRYSSDRRRSHSRSRSVNRGSGICYYHRRYKEQARKCVSPCAFVQKNE
ncbi:alcohol dehydrogenase class-3 chain L [Trichonephila clavipes]|nr:alcohol dehydrogenase class-3 chain L [Trichonephila clavipes]